MTQFILFQEYVSDMIPLERALPDTRGEWCKREYDEAQLEGGKRTSLIICFHNEVCLNT